MEWWNVRLMEKIEKNKTEGRKSLFSSVDRVGSFLTNNERTCYYIKYLVSHLY